MTMRYSGNKKHTAKRHFHVPVAIIMLVMAAGLFGLAIFLPDVSLKIDDSNQRVQQNSDDSSVKMPQVQNNENGILKTIRIVNSSGEKFDFEVEIADTPQKSAKGLMFRTVLPEHRGMLFIAPGDQIWTMWMKNTYIPLDMIYFKRDGEIVKIIKKAKPHDLTHLSSDMPVAGVLEIGGGVTDKLGIEVGDRIFIEKIK